MLGRTRILGEELVKALERVDELLEAHDQNKGHAWLAQPWKLHIGKAIAHLANALVNQEDGVEIEASHGACRAIMGLRMILDDPNVEHRLCHEHAKGPSNEIELHPRPLPPIHCHAHKDPRCRFCGTDMARFCWDHGRSNCRDCYLGYGDPLCSVHAMPKCVFCHPVITSAP